MNYVQLFDCLRNSTPRLTPRELARVVGTYDRIQYNIGDHLRLLWMVRFKPTFDHNRYVIYKQQTVKQYHLKFE